MIIALVTLIVRVIIPQLLSALEKLAEPVIVGTIMIIAIAIMLSAIGIRIFRNIGSHNFAMKQHF